MAGIGNVFGVLENAARSAAHWAARRAADRAGRAAEQYGQQIGEAALQRGYEFADRLQMAVRNPMWTSWRPFNVTESRYLQDMQDAVGKSTALPPQVGRPFAMPSRVNPMTALHLASRRRMGRVRLRRRVRKPGGPVGTVRRYVARTPREMPLYAPPAAVRDEQKYRDIHDLALAVNSTGAIWYLTDIEQGNTYYQRVAQRVVLTGLLIRGLVYASVNTVFADCNFSVVYDRQPTTIVPPITDIYDAVNPLSLQRADTRDRFHILWRATYQIVGSSDPPRTDLAQHVIEVSLSFRKLLVYDQTATSGAIGTARVGALYFVAMGSSAPVAAEQPYFLGNFRFPFLDG